MGLIEKFGLVLIGVILSGIGYLIKRKIENKPQLESLDKHKKLLDIHKQMNDQDIDVDGLRTLEIKLNSKAEAIQNHTVILQSESTPLLNSENDEHLTQFALNQRASDNLKEAKDKMQKTLSELDSKIGDHESQALTNSQHNWENYSVSQAEAAAASYNGGSIYPLIYLSELESLTNERTARLQVELDELIRLGN